LNALQKQIDPVGRCNATSINEVDLSACMLSMVLLFSV